MNFIGLVSCVIAQGNINRQLSCSLMLWRESLESSLTQLEQEEFVVEVSLRKKPFDLKVLETRTNEWSGRLQTLLDSLISLQTHLLPGSAVVEREDGGEGQLSQSEKTHPSYLIPHLLGSLEKGMVLLRLTVDSKLETQFLIRKQIKDECDGMRNELEKARQLQYPNYFYDPRVQNEEARHERRQLRHELKHLKILYDTQHNDLLMQVHDANIQCATYKTQAEECERLARACEKELSVLRTRVTQIESERDSARACTLELRAQLMKEEEARSRLTTEFIKLAVVETQREAVWNTKLRDAISKPTLSVPSITSPTPEPTLVVSPTNIASHPSTIPSHHLHNGSHNSLPHHLNQPILFPPPAKHDVDNSYLHHNDALHKGSLRSKGSLHAEISLAAEEKRGDLGLTKRLLHARLTSLGSP